MRFVHEDPEFQELVRIVANDAGLAPALVEKDYWVTHVLWTLQRTHLEVWLKGGTSLSKGYALIQRFSEDLDLRIEPGAALDVPEVTSWKSTNKGPVSRRRAFYEALEKVIVVPGAPFELDTESIDRDARSASYLVRYPGLFTGDLHPVMRPFVLLEVGTARVTPFVSLPIRSFVHDWLRQRDQIANYERNQPERIRCVHPLVTLVEKADAIVRRHRRGSDPASYIRHYEDMARIIEAIQSLPALGMEVSSLAEEMIEQKQIIGLPAPDDPAFALSQPDRRAALLRASNAIAPMFWGERLPFEEACTMVRTWLGAVRRR